MGTIYDDCYIVMSEYGIQRMTKRPGVIKRGEVAVKVRLHIPESVFVEPALTAEISIPESMVIPTNVKIDVIAESDAA